MYELTNAQRACFGLKPVEDHWVPMVLKPSPYYPHTTVAYREGLTLRKVVYSGQARYIETELCEQLSEDMKYLLPKTGRGKPVPLTAASLEKRGGMGMCLWWTTSPQNLRLFHQESQRVWYDGHYEEAAPQTLSEFTGWVDAWCADTTQKDLDDIAALVKSKRVHVKYREGDVFRFPITRRLWGYGRILLDYRLLKKQKSPTVSTFLSRSLDCAVYHIVTERSDVTAAELQNLPCLPSCHFADNRICYGDFEIIGHIPVGEKEDWPIMYELLRGEAKLQCGRLFRSVSGASEVIDWGFGNIYHSPWLDVRLSILRECIEAGSNDPYWAAQTSCFRRDLRSPRHRAELEAVCRQMGLAVEDLL